MWFVVSATFVYKWFDAEISYTHLAHSYPVDKRAIVTIKQLNNILLMYLFATFNLAIFTGFFE